MGVPIAESCFVQNAVFGVPAIRAAPNKVVALAKKVDRKAANPGGKKVCVNVISKVKVGPLARDATRLLARAACATATTTELLEV